MAKLLDIDVTGSKISYKVNESSNTFTYTIVYNDASKAEVARTIMFRVNGNINPDAITIAKFVKEQKENKKENINDDAKKLSKKDTGISSKFDAYQEIKQLLKENESKSSIIDYIKDKYTLLKSSEILDLYLSVYRSLEKEDKKENEKEDFAKKVNALTDDEIKIATKFFASGKMINEQSVENIMNKYNLTLNELSDAVIVRKKQEERMKNNNEKVNTVSYSFGSKVDILMPILRRLISEKLPSEKLAKELDKLSREYDVSRDSMSILYDRASLTIEKANVLKDVRNVLTGSKIVRKPFASKTNDNMIINDVAANPKQEFIERAKGLVIPELYDEWCSMVAKNYRDPVHIYEAINVMQMAQAGESLRNIRKHLDSIHNSSWNAKKTVKLVSDYSPYGKQVSKGCRKYMMSKPERLKAFVLDKTSKFSLHKKEEISINDKVEELRRLKEQIANLTVQANEIEKGKAM